VIVNQQGCIFISLSIKKPPIPSIGYFAITRNLKTRYFLLYIGVPAVFWLCTKLLVILVVGNIILTL